MLWLFLFASPFSVAILYAACFLPVYGGVTLSHMIFVWSAGVVVVGAMLGARLSSLTPRYGDKFWFGCVVLAFVFILSVVHVLANKPLEEQCPDADQAYMITLVPPTMGALGALLGAHYSARLKKRLGAD